MYIHVGYNKVLNVDKIIGVFDSDMVRTSKEIGFIPENKREEFLLHKSIILLENGDIEFSNIKVKYLLNRFRKSIRGIGNG